MEEVIIPTFEEFMEKLYSLTPVGPAEIIYKILRSHIGKTLTTYPPQILTFDLLIKRYKDYLLYVAPYNNVKDKQYIKKDKEQKELGVYIQLELYNNDYSQLINDPNDAYLFGI